LSIENSSVDFRRDPGPYSDQACGLANGSAAAHPARPMKPRTTLAETRLPDGATLALQEHDGRLSLVIHGQQICGPATQAAERELARLACAPFRPARQPKLWIAGFGLGAMVATAADILRQKRATFIVAEPLAELVDWHRAHLPGSPLHEDARIVIEGDAGPSGLLSQIGSLHAILLHLEASPWSPRNRPWPEDPRWLAAAYEALQQGGLLAIAGSRRTPGLAKRLVRSGFEVSVHDVPSAAGARKPRLHPLWLARKGGKGRG